MGNLGLFLDLSSTIVKVLLSCQHKKIIMTNNVIYRSKLRTCVPLSFQIFPGNFITTSFSSINFTLLLLFLIAVLYKTY